MELQGKIKSIGQTQTFGNNGFQKREVVITTEEQYPQTILIEFHQGNTILLDAFKIGHLVEISINIRGREWVNPQGETKYFNSIVGWKITLKGNAPAQPVAQPQPTQSFEPQEEDLPF